MKVSSFAVARPAFYDRSAISVMLDGSVNAVAPHTFTTRFTQTCPSGSKYVVELVTNQLYRQAAATVSGTVITFVRIVDAAGSLSINVSFYTGTPTTVGALFGNNQPSSVTMYPAEVIAGLTYDASTGGTVNYVLGSKLTQYSA
jgi:hypothetical protein